MIIVAPPIFPFWNSLPYRIMETLLESYKLSNGVLTRRIKLTLKIGLYEILKLETSR